MERTKRNVLLVGGEAEGDRLSRLAKSLPAERIRIAQSLPLTELAGLLARCDHFVGHDSGISHLAAALGLLGHLLWAETSTAVWAPRAEGMRLLQSPQGLHNLAPDAVASAILESLSAEAKANMFTRGRKDAKR